MQTLPNDKKSEARKNSGLRLDLKTLALLAGMHLLFWGNAVLYFLAPLPLIVHMLFSAVAIHMAFTIWHEAGHSNVSNRAWVNNIVGILGMFPYMTPYFSQKWIHLQHHKYMNEDKDPNAVYARRPFWLLPLRYFKGAQYVKNMMKNNPLSPGERRSDLISLFVVGSIYAVAFLTGYGVDIMLVWFLPFLGAKVMMDWYVNYLPHVDLPADRFLGTRIITLAWLKPLLLCHNYHAIHHLWPRYPWHQYESVFHQKHDYLVEKGVPIQATLRTRSQG